MEYPNELVAALEAFDREWFHGDRDRAKLDATWIRERWPEHFERWVGRDMKYMIAVITAGRGECPWSDGVVKPNRNKKLLADVFTLTEFRKQHIEGHLATGVRHVLNAIDEALARGPQR